MTPVCPVRARSTSTKMASRVKSTFNVSQEENKLTIEFQEPVDYVIVDFNLESAMLSLSFEDRPFDEMVTLKFSGQIDMKASKHVHDKSADKKLRLNVVKLASDEYTVTSEHKFIEKRNHPKADPRGYQVKKPEKKNWDKIVATLDDSDEGEGDANSALKKIYDGCDDDTKRAMEKSLYESHGTVLNMNWAEVGKGKVKPYESSDVDNFKGFDRHRD